jgi:hypothetical protein
MEFPYIQWPNPTPPCPPKKPNFPQVMGLHPVNLTTIDGLGHQEDTSFTTKIWKQSMCHWDGTNPKTNDEVAPNFIIFPNDIFVKSFVLNDLLLN